MFSFPREQTQIQTALLQLSHQVRSTTKQVANSLHHLLVEPTLNNFIQPLYIELTYFNSEVLQLHHILSNLSYRMVHPALWTQAIADLRGAKAALDSTVNDIYINGEINVGTLRREKDAFVKALNSIKFVRRSLQTVYIVVCNSAFSASAQHRCQLSPQHLQSISQQPLNWTWKQSQPPVYIVHAGEDKLTIALPLWKKLRAEGIHTFLDREEMQVGDDKETVLKRAMDAAQFCVIITSPELAAKKWPMLEVDHFLQRSRSEGAQAPVILPIFYRLSTEDCHGYEYFGCRDRDGRNLFIRHGFFERVMLRQTSVENVVECLRELTGKVGLENDEKASNDDTAKMARRRERLISRVVGAVVTLVHKA